MERYNKRIYRKEIGGSILLEQQLKFLKRVKEKCIYIKINTVICPEINYKKVEEIAKKIAVFGADMMNCIPLYLIEIQNFLLCLCLQKK